MLEISLHEDVPNGEEEGIQVNVDPSYMDDGESDFAVVKEEEMDDSGMASYAMEMVIKNGNKLAVISPEEEAYRKKLYKTMNIVLRKRLHCTVCDAHIGCYLDLNLEEIEHPLLKVLSCARCTFTYKHIDFPLTPDGKDVRCRWCTKPSSEDSPLRFCKFCPFAFCEMCIYRNLPLDELSRNKGVWMCIVCNMSELWPSRAVLWALIAQIQFNQSREGVEKWEGDVSQCCKSNKGKAGKSMSKIEEDKRTNGHGFPGLGLGNIRDRNIFGRMLGYHDNKKTTVIMPDPNSKSSVMRSIHTAEKIERPRPLPASKYETHWLKDKIDTICTTLLALNKNLKRVSESLPDVDDKFNIKSKMISITSLLNIGSNQITMYTKELENEWKKVLETKSYKIVKKGLLRRNPVPYRRTSAITKTFELSPVDRLYMEKYNIKPCYVKLNRVDKFEVINIDD